MMADLPPGFSGKARYVQLAESLLKNIAEGGYAVGSLMPTEADLGLQFGVSRTTVREAMRHLSDMGLVTRKAGVGTTVKAKYAPPRFVHAIESISDIFQYTQRAGKPSILSSTDMEASKADADLLQCQPGQRWLRFEMLRSLSGKHTPMVLSEAYVLPAYARIVELAPTRAQPVYTLLESEYGEAIVEVQQEFRALNTNRRQARLLEVKAGSAALNVVRHYFGRGDRLLLVTLSVYPPDRFTYAMRLRYNQRKET